MRLTQYCDLVVTSSESSLPTSSHSLTVYVLTTFIVCFFTFLSVYVFTALIRLQSSHCRVLHRFPYYVFLALIVYFFKVLIVYFFTILTVYFFTAITLNVLTTLFVYLFIVLIFYSFTALIVYFFTFLTIYFFKSSLSTYFGPIESLSNSWREDNEFKIYSHRNTLAEIIKPAI